MGIMTDPLLILEQKTSQKAQQTQQLMMTPHMQQALYFLQLPIMELTQEIEKELEQNPVLEAIEEEEKDKSEKEEPEDEDTPVEQEIDIDDNKLEILKQLDEEYRDFYAESGGFNPKLSKEEEKKKVFLEASIEERPSLSHLLMKQAREAIPNEEELKAAEVLIGYIDEKGFFNTPLQEISTLFSIPVPTLEKALAVVRTFEPLGTGAQDVREALLLQLKAQGLEQSLAYRIIHECYEDFLHNRMPVLKKTLKCSFEEIKEAINEKILPLDLHPGGNIFEAEPPTITADIKIAQEGEGLITALHEEEWLPLKINHKYLRMLKQEGVEKETKRFIENKILSAKWLIRNVEQRGETLLKIGKFLADYQKPFFDAPEGRLLPLTLRQVAEALQLHESTVARAVANKYVDTPKGMLSLKSFFTASLVDNEGEAVSAKTVKDWVRDFIEKEDKKRPLSDEMLARKITLHGIKVARRTIAKYRGELGLGNAQQRRQY
jgi:RNA polymerase sigma-54 factor